MKVWYYDIPPGTYTIHQIIELSTPKQTYHCVYQALKRLKVECSKKEVFHNNYNIRNEKKVWQWKGAEFYLKKENYKL